MLKQIHESVHNQCHFWVIATAPYPVEKPQGLKKPLTLNKGHDRKRLKSSAAPADSHTGSTTPEGYQTDDWVDVEDMTFVAF